MGHRLLLAGFVLALSACSGVSPQPAEPARGRGSSDIPDTALPSERASIFASRERAPERDLEFPPAPLPEDLRKIALRNLTDNTVELDRKALVVRSGLARGDVIAFRRVHTSHHARRCIFGWGGRCGCS